MDPMVIVAGVVVVGLVGFFVWKKFKKDDTLPPDGSGSAPDA